MMYLNETDTSPLSSLGSVHPFKSQEAQPSKNRLTGMLIRSGVSTTRHYQSIDFRAVSAPLSLSVLVGCAQQSHKVHSKQTEARRRMDSARQDVRIQALHNPHGNTR